MDGVGVGVGVGVSRQGLRVIVIVRMGLGMSGRYLGGGGRRGIGIIDPSPTPRIDRWWDAYL